MNDEDVDRFGEFICSYNAWLPIDIQKAQAKRLENITKSQKDAK